MIERIPFGIKNLDSILEGGIPKGNIILLAGSPGSGKTIFGLNYIINGVKYKEKGIFISLEMNYKDLVEQALQFGWDIQKLEKNNKIKIISEKELNEIKYLIEEYGEKGYSRLVLDSLTFYYEVLSLYEMEKDKYKNIHSEILRNFIYRDVLLSLFKTLKKYNYTSLLISEIEENSNRYSKCSIAEFLTDGIIRLYYSKIGGLAFGRLEIRKMRKTKYKKGLYEFNIGKKGIEIGEEVITLK